MTHQDSEPWLCGMAPRGERPLSSAERIFARQLPILLRRRSVLRVGSLAVAILVCAAVVALAATSGGTGWASLGLALVLPGAAGVVHGFVSGRTWWRAVAGILATGLCTVWTVALVFDWDLSDPTERLAFNVFVALVLMGWGHGVTTWQCWTRSKPSQARLQADLRRAVAHEFEGVPDRSSPLGMGLNRTGLLKRDSNVRQRVALLPETGLVVSVNGRPADRIVSATPVVIAIPRCHALRVPLPNSSFDDGASGVRKLCKRTLSADECHELHHHAGQLRRIEPTWVFLLFGALGIGMFGASEATWAGWRPDLLFWTLLVSSVVVIQTRRWIAAWRLDRDSKLRWVATVDAPRQPDATPPVLEILPLSRVAWTEYGRPAHWRHAGD